MPIPTATPASTAAGNQREHRLFAGLDDDRDGRIDAQILRRVLEDAGLVADDTRLTEVFAALDAHGDAPLDLDNFSRLIAPASLLVERALQGALHAADYDGRTALHIAAAEGHNEVVEYLRAHGHPISCRDRWGSTPLDEAERENRQDTVQLLHVDPKMTTEMRAV